MVSADRSIERNRRTGRRSARRLAAAATTILGMTVLAACGGSGSGAAGSSSTPATSANSSTSSDAGSTSGAAPSSGSASSAQSGGGETTASGDHTLTIWHAYVGQDDKVKFMQGALADFQKAHPEIKLNVVGLEQNAYKTKLQTAMASGEVPDVFYTLPGGYLSNFAKSGQVYPLDGDLAKDGWGDTFVKTALSQVQTDGKTYAVPIDTDAAVMWYNKALFTQNGWQIPQTWDQFTALCEQIKNAGITPIALGNKDSWPATFWFQYGELRRQGPDVINKFNAKDPSATFGDGAQASMDAMRQLAQKGYFSDGFNGMSDQDANLLFLNSQAAMVLNGTWQIGSSADAPSGFELGYFPFPTVDGGNPSYANDVVAGVAAAFAISQKSADKADAVTFLKFLTSEKEMTSYVDIRKTMVNVKGATTEQAAGPLLYGIAQDVVGKAGALDPFYDTAMPPKAMQTYYNTLQGVLDGGTSAADGASALESAMKAGQ
jgi:raffinose/stachyose/melibiose transport system substrate-binding protein